VTKLAIRLFIAQWSNKILIAYDHPDYNNSNNFVLCVINKNRWYCSF